MKSKNYDLAVVKFRKILNDPEMKQGMRYVIESRDIVLARYQPVFRLDNILSLREDDFRSFLYFENNRHWSGLYRKGLAICDDVGFFQAVRARIIKSSPEHELRTENTDQAIRQIISRSIASDEVIDIFKAAGLNKPDISILSDEFLADVQNMPQKNVAIELLRKLLNDEIKLRSRKNVVQSRSFLEMLERTIRAYQNRAIEVAEVITELVELGKEIREANKRGEVLKLSEDELAFYDAIEVNDSAVKVLGDDTLKDIARELVKSVRENATIDWTMKENVRAKLRVMVRRILRRHGYPPDKQEKATQTVLEQAEVIAKDWAG